KQISEEDDKVRLLSRTDGSIGSAYRALVAPAGWIRHSGSPPPRSRLTSARLDFSWSWLPTYFTSSFASWRLSDNKSILRMALTEASRSRTWIHSPRLVMGTVTARLVGWSELAPAFLLVPLSMSAAIASATLLRRSASLSAGSESNDLSCVSTRRPERYRFTVTSRRARPGPPRPPGPSATPPFHPRFLCAVAFGAPGFSASSPS